MSGTNDLATGKKFRTLTALALLGGVAFLGACDDDATGPEDMATFQVLLTDAPSDMLESAEVWISHVYLQGGEDEGEVEGEGAAGGRVDLFNDPANPQYFDLLELRDGVTADLTGEVAVDPAGYGQLRFIVDSARVTLAEGYTFEDGTISDVLKVPGGAQSGIKVNLNRLIDLDPGDDVALTVDADVDQNFVIQMANDGTVRRVLFTPVLKELERVEDDPTL